MLAANSVRSDAIEDHDEEEGDFCNGDQKDTGGDDAILEPDGKHCKDEF